MSNKNKNPPRPHLSLSHSDKAIRLLADGPLAGLLGPAAAAATAELGTLDPHCLGR